MTSKGRQWLRWHLIGMVSVMGLIYLAGGCAPEEPVSPCGPCDQGFFCDVSAKRCVPLGCYPCEYSVDCNKGQRCQDGCCVGGAPLQETITPTEPNTEPHREIDEPKDDAGTEPATPESPPEAKVETPWEQPPACATPPCNRPCKTDADCTDSLQPFCKTLLEVCVGCRDEKDCQAGQACTNGTCIGQPKSLCDGVTCPTGESCCPNDGTCQTCCKDGDCGSDEICQDRGGSRSCQPKPPCDPACTSGTVCDETSKTCVPDCNTTGCTQPDTKCDTPTGRCVALDCRSNTTCQAGQICNNVTGKCEAPDCRKAGQGCQAPSCCNTTNGKCTTNCKACGCASTSLVCDTATGVCKPKTCKSPSKCSSSADCCGRRCQNSGFLGLGGKKCRCTSSTQCQSPWKCETSIIDKYCK